VCPENVLDFVAHVAQVNGWSLEDIAPQAKRVVSPPLFVPLLYGGSSRHTTLPAPWVSIPFGRMYDKRTGEVRHTTRAALSAAFKIREDAHIIVSGTDEDAVIERWWEHRDRSAVLASLRALDVDLITTPNYSLFSKTPRPDHWYNMKRIAITWAEIVGAGLPAALHLNACADDEWDTWVDFLRSHQEIGHVAFEFGTGAGSRRRAPWHVSQLVRLAQQIGRPVHLTLRGGFNVIRVLAAAFASVTFVDSTPYLRTMKRRIPMPIVGNRREWVPFRTDQGEDVTNLLTHAIAERAAQLLALVQGGGPTVDTEQDTETRKPLTSANCATYALLSDGLSPEIIKT
jgi:hypothetical protein